MSNFPGSHACVGVRRKETLGSQAGEQCCWQDMGGWLGERWSSSKVFRSHQESVYEVKGIERFMLNDCLVLSVNLSQAWRLRCAGEGRYHCLGAWAERNTVQYMHVNMRTVESHCSPAYQLNLEQILCVQKSKFRSSSIHSGAQIHVNLSLRLQGWLICTFSTTESTMMYCGERNIHGSVPKPSK